MGFYSYYVSTAWTVLTAWNSMTPEWLLALTCKGLTPTHQVMGIKMCSIASYKVYQNRQHEHCLWIFAISFCLSTDLSKARSASFCLSTDLSKV